jgi:hypothetical protein
LLALAAARRSAGSALGWLGDDRPDRAVEALHDLDDMRRLEEGILVAALLRDRDPSASMRALRIAIEPQAGLDTLDGGIDVAEAVAWCAWTVDPAAALESIERSGLDRDRLLPLVASRLTIVRSATGPRPLLVDPPSTAAPTEPTRDDPTWAPRASSMSLDRMPCYTTTMDPRIHDPHAPFHERTIEDDLIDTVADEDVARVYRVDPGHLSSAKLRLLKLALAWRREEDAVIADVGDEEFRDVYGSDRSQIPPERARALALALRGTPPAPPVRPPGVPLDASCDRDGLWHGQGARYDRTGRRLADTSPDG